jgi:hypothetical protein
MSQQRGRHHQSLVTAFAASQNLSSALAKEDVTDVLLAHLSTLAKEDVTDALDESAKTCMNLNYSVLLLHKDSLIISCTGGRRRCVE